MTVTFSEIQEDFIRISVLNWINITQPKLSWITSSV